MKNLTYTIALTTALLATSCSDNSDIATPTPINPNDKEMISFSMSDGSVSGGGTRAEGLTRAGFNGTYGGSSSQKTQILMHIESQKGSESKWKFTKTQAVADPEAGSVGYSDVTFPEVYRRYWDDAHGRDSKLSIYAVAIPNLSTISSSTAAINGEIEEGDLTSAASGEWGVDLNTEPTHTIKWSVNKAQNATTLYSEDLVYSNNIQESGSDGRYWYDYSQNKWQPDGTAESIIKTGLTTHGPGCMQFLLSNTSDPTSAGKFDKGHLVFKHALSRITIKLIEGVGFNHAASSPDFNFTDATNQTINLYKMNYTGTLNLKDGTWVNTTAIENATPVRITPGNKQEESTTVDEKTIYTGKYSCSAQILPDYELTNNKEENVLDFTIDGNTYYIQNKMLWKALDDNAGTGDGKNGLTKGNSYKMEQGKNYVFTIIVDKKQINSVTATLVPWSDVAAANEHINNAHVTFSTHIESGDKTEVKSDLHLFRLAEDLGSINTTGNYTANKYRGDYEDEAVATYNDTDKKWSTNWFFEDNKTAYHFRSVNTLACVGSTENTNHNSEDDAQNKKQSNFGTAENVSVYSETRNCTYFNMSNGAIADHDYQWGAPFVTTANTKYYEYKTDNGFEDIIHKGITSTESPINITQLHMMSQINVIVRTTDQCYGTSGSETAVNASNAIALQTGESGSETQCEVTLTRLYNHGKVDMGTGLIGLDKTGITNGVKASEEMTKPEANITSNDETGDALLTIDGKKYSTKQTKAYTFNVIPQKLYRGTETTTEGINNDNEDMFIGITIKTPDNNQYYVVKRLSQILATDIGTSQNQEKDKAITYWYPNHSYTYTFTITKKGIESITCTLADWSHVTGQNININLED